MKNYFKGISITLISAMLFTFLPVQVLAAGTSEPSIDSVPVNQPLDRLMYTKSKATGAETQ